MNAYIVANKEQEKYILKVLSDKGDWWFDKTPIMEYVPSEHFLAGEHFPYVFYENSASMIKVLPYRGSKTFGARVLYNGLKESESKIKVSKEVYDGLVKWKEHGDFLNHPVTYSDMSNLTVAVEWWRHNNNLSVKEKNNRLIAIIRWVNGEDVFEIEKPKKWVVRSKDTDVDGDYRYVQRDSSFQIEFMVITPSFTLATRFDNKEEAESWSNAHQEVIEVEE